MNVKKCLLTLSVAFAATLAASADAPADYYKSCEGKSKSALKSQLYTLLSSHTEIPYGSGSNSTWGAFYYTDRTDDGKYWFDIYTTNNVAVGSYGSAASGMNIEHTFPKSWWGGGKNAAYKDIVHLMPSNSVANSTRGNWPYGEVATAKSISNKCSNPTFKYGTPKSGQGGGAATVFEPADDLKGDLARTYFYMVTCYQNLSWSSDGLRTAAQGTYPTLQPWAMEMLLRWHRNDPVSEKEQKRNDGVYERQGNRNPFIDHPEMVEHIWGNLQDQAWHSGETPVIPDPVDPTPVDPVGDPELTSPIPGASYTFGDVALGNTGTIEIPLLGSGFTHSLVAKIDGRDADQFQFIVGSMKLSAVSITKNDVNNSDGYFLKVVYTPTSGTAEGYRHEAQVTISGQDLTQPVQVTISGTSLADFEVLVPTALAAEDITDESYKARWIKTTQDVDFYTVYRDIYDEDGQTIVVTDEYDVDPDCDYLLIDSRMTDLRERYCVTATVGGKESDKSNYITIEPGNNAIQAIQAADASRTLYYTVDGILIGERPSQRGIYIVKQGSTVQKLITLP